MDLAQKPSAGRRLVVSAVNFTEGGPLTVLREFVDAACRVLPDEWEIVVFAHDRTLLVAPRARIIPVPHARRSWLRRLWVEWYEFRGHARQLKPDLWVSLHDTSPNVGRVPQAVYCHNPAPFLRIRPRDAIFEPTVLMFRLAYAWLYRINLGRNRAVIVQQSWLREAFRKWVSEPTEIIVAHPVQSVNGTVYDMRPNWKGGPARFLYPALPRAFKNIELLCRAVEHLESGGLWKSVVILTTDGEENRYARWLKRRFGKLRSLRFAGRQSRAQMHLQYGAADCLLFPSRLETWGLPISEAKKYGLPMFVANLPYAVETVGNYPAVEFIDVDDWRSLAQGLLAFQQGTFRFQPVSGTIMPQAPFAPDWTALITKLASLAT